MQTRELCQCNLSTVSFMVFLLVALWTITFDLEDGATNDVPANATAYVHLNTLVSLSVFHL